MIENFIFTITAIGLIILIKKEIRKQRAAKQERDKIKAIIEQHKRKKEKFMNNIMTFEKDNAVNPERNQ